MLLCMCACVCACGRALVIGRSLRGNIFTYVTSVSIVCCIEVVNGGQTVSYSHFPVHSLFVLCSRFYLSIFLSFYLSIYLAS